MEQDRQNICIQFKNKQTRFKENCREECQKENGWYILVYFFLVRFIWEDGKKLQAWPEVINAAVTLGKNGVGDWGMTKIIATVCRFGTVCVYL